MTQQEAQALTAQLTGVWQPQKIWMSYLGSICFNFHALLASAGPQQLDLELMIRIDIENPISSCSLYVRETCQEWQSGHGINLKFYEESRGEFEDARGRPMESLRKGSFPILHLSYFRRNCWLSGFDINATAHEKAEWLQNFSAEETESWTLKF